MEKPIKTFKKFVFEGWEQSYDGEKGELEIKMNYGFTGRVKDDEGKSALSFCEILRLPVVEGDYDKCDKTALGKAIEGLMIIGGISYYKAFLPDEIVGLDLDSWQAEFWSKVYLNGLGEFFYRNKLDFEGLCRFEANLKSDQVATTVSSSSLPNSSLVAIGGGKDSLVSIELLKEMGENVTLISLRDAGPIANTAKVAGRPRIIISREIDSLLFTLNEQGAYNGHVPITAYISFLLAASAILYGHDKVVMSLEKSANVGQVLFNGLDVNHQYSKSEAFELDFSSYIRKYIHGELKYFSLLRPLHEIKIAEIFIKQANFESYKSVFSSCNRNFKINKNGTPALWCGECPKCAFVFLILSPFLSRSELVTIFGKDMFADISLKNLFLELLGMRDIKPFECVGTFEESALAFHLTSQKEDYAGSEIVASIVDEFNVFYGDMDFESLKKELLGIGENTNIPEDFYQYLKKYENQ